MEKYIHLKEIEDGRRLLEKTIIASQEELKVVFGETLGWAIDIATTGGHKSFIIDSDVLFK